MCLYSESYKHVLIVSCVLFMRQELYSTLNTQQSALASCVVLIWGKRSKFDDRILVRVFTAFFYFVPFVIRNFKLKKTFGEGENAENGTQVHEQVP